jgi:hypothetical protein
MDTDSSGLLGSIAMIEAAMPKPCAMDSQRRVLHPPEERADDRMGSIILDETRGAMASPSWPEFGWSGGDEPLPYDLVFRD